ncbi:MazG-like family protein [anaerobic digester metagenome]
MNNQWDFYSEVAAIIEFRDKRNWRQFHYPKELAAAISIETAELQELFLWKGQESSEHIISDCERMDKISDEVADIAIYLFLLTHELNIDLRVAVAQKLKKNAMKYPIMKTPKTNHISYSATNSP